MSHTKGPWRLIQITGLKDNGSKYILASEGHFSHGSLEKVSEADANLIVSAPELFDALKFIVNRLDLFTEQDQYPLKGVHQDFKKLIFKIEGK